MADRVSIGWCARPPETKLSSMTSFAALKPASRSPKLHCSAGLPSGSLSSPAAAKSPASHLTVCRLICAPATLPFERASGPLGNRLSSGSVTWGSCSKSILIASIASAAISSLSAATARIGSPTKNTASLARIGGCGGGNCGTSSAVRMPSTPLILSAADVSMRRILACGIGLVRDLQNTMPSARKSSAYLARPVTLAVTSTGTKSLPMRLYAMSSLPGCAHDGSQVMVVGSAPADVAGHGAPRLLDRRFGVLLQQGNSRDDLAGRTEAALGSEFRDHSLLHFVQFAVRPFDAFDGGDLAPTHRVSKGRARIGRDVIEHDGAVAAFGMIAAELGAGEAELVAQRVDQGLVRQHIDGPVAAVDVEGDQAPDGARSLRMRRAAAEHQVPGRRHRHARGDHAFDERTPRGAQLVAARTTMVMASSFFVMMFASRT